MPRCNHSSGWNLLKGPVGISSCKDLPVLPSGVSGKIEKHICNSSVYMYICIYVIYVYMYICIYVYMYICIYVYKHVYIYIYIYIQSMDMYINMIKYV